MEKGNFTFSFESSKTPDVIFELLLDVQKWWVGLYDEKIEGASHQIGDEFSFNAGGGLHYSKQRLVEISPNKKIEWLVVDSKLSFLKDESEWTNTKICFEIYKEKDKTIVSFTHDGLVSEIECFEQCSSAWTQYLQKLKLKLM